MTPALEPELVSAISDASGLQTIAHEIRQPLSTIESIAYYLSLVLPEEHREQVTRLRQLVEQSNCILSNGLALPEPRPSTPQTLDLEELIAQTIAARPASLDPPVSGELEAKLPLVHLDFGLARALIE